jgi:hypothetical protein
MRSNTSLKSEARGCDGKRGEGMWGVGVAPYLVNLTQKFAERNSGEGWSYSNSEISLDPRKSGGPLRA